MPVSPGGATEDVHALSPTSRASQAPLIGQGERPSCVCTCAGWKPDLESLAFRAGKGRGGREKAARLPLPPTPAPSPSPCLGPEGGCTGDLAAMARARAATTVAGGGGSSSSSWAWARR
ncbi:uncharacterized protein LOC115063604 [Mus pahari]|uniref:uncharacterized protein LOC115063604 n=1 Tax=Mus pahari TaxID=10093 RepID=UPI0011147D74|nr:uncharacterized protein LOC115063604 [Mus pahari]